MASTQSNLRLAKLAKKNNLNFLRLVLALIVLVYHSMILSGNDYTLIEVFDSHLAVCGFFVLSGFLIIRSYLNSSNLQSYLVKRARRLIPAYFLVVILCALGLGITSNLPIEKYFASAEFWKYLPSNLSFLNFLQAELPGVFANNPTMAAVNGSLWTIKVEVSFYLFIPVLVWLMGFLKTLKKANLFLLAMYVFGYVFQNVMLTLAEQKESAIYNILAHQLPGYLAYFAVGIFAALNFEIAKKYMNKLMIPALGLIAIYKIWDLDHLLPLALGVIILWVGFNFSKLNNIASKSDYSYGIYLFHFPIAQVLISLGVFQSYPILGIFAVLALTLILAFMSWHLLEKRVLHRG